MGTLRDKEQETGPSWGEGIAYMAMNFLRNTIHKFSSIFTSKGMETYAIKPKSLRVQSIPMTMSMTINPLEAELEKELEDEFGALKTRLKENQKRADEFTLTAVDEKMEKMTQQFEKARNLYRKVKIDLEAERDSGTGKLSLKRFFFSSLILFLKPFRRGWFVTIEGRLRYRSWSRIPTAAGTLWSACTWWQKTSRTESRTTTLRSGRTKRCWRAFAVPLGEPGACLDSSVACPNKRGKHILFPCPSGH